MVRRLALFVGLLCLLAADASPAAEIGAPLFALPPLPETDFPGRQSGLAYALIGFPDGSAALQATVTDLSKDVEEPPERLWLIKIDAAGQAGHWRRVPALSAYGAEAALGLGDGSIVFRSGDRGFFYLAKVDRSGALLWEQYLGSGTFGSFPRPIALADGFAILEDDWRSCQLHRLDENGIERWHVAMPDPIERETASSFCDPIMVAPRADGGFLVLCNWHNLALERSDGWLFDIDPQGQPRGQLPLRAYAAIGLALRDGTLAVFGLLHRIPDDPTDPYQGEADTGTLMRFDGADGQMLRTDSNVFPSEIDWPWDLGNTSELVALPGGELLAVAHLGDFQSSGLFATRISREHRLLWLRPLVDKAPVSSWARICGTAVLASRQVLFAVYSYDKAADIGKVTLRLLPLD